MDCGLESLIDMNSTQKWKMTAPGDTAAETGAMLTRLLGHPPSRVSSIDEQKSALICSKTANPKQTPRSQGF